MATEQGTETCSQPALGLREWGILLVGAVLLVYDGGRSAVSCGMSLRQSRNPALAGIIGGVRPWTALMISALSIPWR